MSVGGKNLRNKTAIFPYQKKCYIFHTFNNVKLSRAIYIIQIFHISNMKEILLYIVPVFHKLVKVRPSWSGEILDFMFHLEIGI